MRATGSPNFRHWISTVGLTEPWAKHRFDSIYPKGQVENCGCTRPGRFMISRLGWPKSKNTTMWTSSSVPSIDTTLAPLYPTTIKCVRCATEHDGRGVADIIIGPRGVLCSWKIGHFRQSCLATSSAARVPVRSLHQILAQLFHCSVKPQRPLALRQWSLLVYGAVCKFCLLFNEFFWPAISKQSSGQIGSQTGVQHKETLRQCL